nr:NAD-glutamate dehydrogenase [Pseudoclavibacter sp. 13-3]
MLIVTPDKPFIVDSLLAELGRQQIDVHAVVHPTFVVTRDRDGRVVSVISPPTAAARTESFALPQPGHEVTVESWVYVSTELIAHDDVRRALVQATEKVMADVTLVNDDWPLMRAQAQRISAELRAAPPLGLEERSAQASRFLEWLDDDNFTFFGYQEYDLVTVDGDDALQRVAGTGLGLFRHSGPAKAPESSSSSSTAPKSSAAAPKPLLRKNLEKARERDVLIITKANSRSTVHRDAFLDYVGVKRFDAFGRVDGERRFLGLFTLASYTQSVLSIPVVAEKVQSVLERSGFRPDSHNGRDVLALLETYPRDELFQADTETLRRNVLILRQVAERRRSWVFLRTDPYERFVTALVYLPRDAFNTQVRLGISDLLQQTYHAAYVEHESRMSDSALARLYFVARLKPGELLPDADIDALHARIIELTRTWHDQLAELVAAQSGQIAAASVARQLRQAFPDSYREAFTPAEALADLPHLAAVSSPEAALTGMLGAVGAPVTAGPADAAVETASTTSVFEAEGVVRTPAPSAVAHADRLSLRLYRDVDGEAHVKVFHDEPIALAEVLPIFTNLGVEVVNEHPFVVQAGSGRSPVYVHDYGVRAADTLDTLAADFAEAFAAAWLGWVESDPLDRLVTTTRATWREVSVLRAYVRYLRQIGLAYSTTFIAETLVDHADITLALVELFEQSFDPAVDGTIDERRVRVLAIQADIEQALTKITSLDTDTVLRRLAEAVIATVRTSAYQFAADGSPKPQITFKIEPRRISGVPQPVPLFELWVYSPEVEGVHLRFGQVARGGLRWSDRREDFRTEVLGLVKAQVVKNAVIVPTGAKGGFYPKRLPDPNVDRGAWMAAGEDAYRLFVSGMLDVTDNRDLAAGTVTHPDAVVAYDPDDPYLVVAADKGTARFSDTANEIAIADGFWLQDAFASGGSHGYDHKAMGITARGAWTSVERHFRELGVDVATDPFTAVGIGDMSGDVFGNGLLRSRSIRLIAAFDHRDIFLDPHPDAEAAWNERLRLYEKPGSSWADYRPELISEGGGVFSRASKAVPISPEVAAVLGLDRDGGAPAALTPNELIKAVLTAPADLLYNGGIGTYVKGSGESDAEIGDRANDAIRVDGRDLRVRVVGEGGNLGFSQAGRVEAAEHGIRLNTDAIDNSAGVDTSDREVNLKILLASPQADGHVLTFDERNELLASMTDEVAHLVLTDNYRQNRALGLERDRSELMPSYQRLIAEWEADGVLDRALEHLPEDGEFDRRIAAGEGLTSPELAIVLSYAKITLKHAILESDVPDESWTDQLLREYFPPEVVTRYGEALERHPLAREIKATTLANDIVDHGGVQFVFSVIEETSDDPAQVVRAWAVIREAFDVDTVFGDIATTDNAVSTDTQDDILIRFKRALGRGVRLLLETHSEQLDVPRLRERYVRPLARLRSELPALHHGDHEQRTVARLVEAGVSDAVAERSAFALEEVHLIGVVDLVDDAQATASSADVPVAPDTSDAALEHAAAVEFLALRRYHLEQLLQLVSRLPRHDLWQTLARSSLRQDVYAVLRQITGSALQTVEASARGDQRDTAAARLDAWETQHAGAIDRVRALANRLAEAPTGDASPLVVALRLLRTVL